MSFLNFLASFNRISKGGALFKWRGSLNFQNYRGSLRERGCLDNTEMKLAQIYYKISCGAQ